MGSVPGGHLPIGKNYHARIRRENQQLAKRPEELIVAIPTGADQEDQVVFLVNTNLHVSGRDTLQPYQDDQHPTGIFATRDAALERAKKVFAILRDAHATALRDTVEFTNRQAGG